MSIINPNIVRERLLNVSDITRANLDLTNTGLINRPPSLLYKENFYVNIVFGYPIIERIVTIADVSVYIFTRIAKFLLRKFPSRLDRTWALSSEWKVHQADF